MNKYDDKMSKETFYFSHDYNASMDEKIIKLLSKHGMTGYGIFWRIVENLYNNANALSLDYDRIAYDLHITDSKIIQSIINDFGLFVTKDGFFGSISIEKRLDLRNEKSEKARKSAFARWDKIKADANALNNDANVMKNDAIKESIEKDIIEKDIIVYSDAFSIEHKPVNIFDSISFKLWKQCYDNMTAKNITPTILKKAKPETWANFIRLMIEQDGRTEAEIKEVLGFLNTDEFWSSNIQSPAKLRGQFERLQLEMRKPKPKRSLQSSQDLGNMDYTVKP